ncbi:hypothetical protein [uncultured Celeribacter sp.]|nr:hypothetical protein [uncultured Celeribacter sp.]
MLHHGHEPFPGLGENIVSVVTLRLPRPWHPVLSYAGLRDLPAPQTP